MEGGEEEYESYDLRPVRISLKLMSCGDVAHMKGLITEIKSLGLKSSFENGFTDLIMFN